MSETVPIRNYETWIAVIPSPRELADDHPWKTLVTLEHNQQMVDNFDDPIAVTQGAYRIIGWVTALRIAQGGGVDAKVESWQQLPLGDWNPSWCSDWIDPVTEQEVGAKLLTLEVLPQRQPSRVGGQGWNSLSRRNDLLTQSTGTPTMSEKEVGG